MIIVTIMSIYALYTLHRDRKNFCTYEYRTTLATLLILLAYCIPSLFIPVLVDLFWIPIVIVLLFYGQLYVYKKKYMK